MATTTQAIAGGYIRKDTVTGAGAISLTVTAKKATKLVSLTMHADSAATTSELLTVTLDANAGAAYDTLLYSLDLSAASTVDLALYPSDSTIFGDILLEAGDAIVIAFANTDTDTYGIQVTTKEFA